MPTYFCRHKGQQPIWWSRLMTWDLPFVFVFKQTLYQFWHPQPRVGPRHDISLLKEYNQQRGSGPRTVAVCTRPQRSPPTHRTRPQNANRRQTSPNPVTRCNPQPVRQPLPTTSQQESTLNAHRQHLVQAHTPHEQHGHTLWRHVRIPA